MHEEYSSHISVMLEEVLQFLLPRTGGTYIDGTVGGGGHTEALLQCSAPDGRVLGIDKDSQALERVKRRLTQYVDSGRLLLVHGNFADMRQIAATYGYTSVQGVLLDLGFSSDQMDDPERGFSFSADGPLDMRLDQSLTLSAADLVNSASEQELADIFWRYGEETRSRQIARRIMRERGKGAITRTAQLAALIATGMPYRPDTIHPATRAFQALRIAVNRELEQLETVLPQIMDLLAQGDRRGASLSPPVGSDTRGRLVIISFHSLEDRIVKEYLRRESTDCICPPRLPVCVCGHRARLRLLTRKPVTPTELEIMRNPRARSAKLRAAEAVETGLAPVSGL
jgi:16S rRNA (cytosine1402-N4)-methyltransferase